MRILALLSLVFLLNTGTSLAQRDQDILANRKPQDSLMVIKGDTINLNQLIREFKPSPPRWSKKNNLSLNLNEVAFVNWNAGGNNSVSGLANVKMERKYKYRNVQWNNEMFLRYGINVQEGQGVRKSDDAIILSSTLGFKMDQIHAWYFSAKANFNTQFSNGYRYPDTSTPISRFLAPGYFFMGVGSEYAPDKKDFTLYISPLTQKSTLVLDQNLADAGSFGVKPAVYNNFGVKVRDGQRIFTEVGILVTNSFQTKIYENMFLSNRLTLYTDYLNSFGNIDVNWILDLELKVNEFVKANLGMHFIYDNDVKFEERVTTLGETIPYGARLQFKQLLGVGLNYNF